MITSKTLNRAHYSQQLWKIYTHSFPFQARDLHRTAIFPRLWNNYQRVVEESNKMGCQVFYSWKILLSCPLHQHGFCKCQLYATSTFRRDQPRDQECYERFVEKYRPLKAKDSSEGNYQGKGKGPTTGRLHEETRFHKSGIVGGTRERF